MKRILKTMLALIIVFMITEITIVYAKEVETIDSVNIIYNESELPLYSYLSSSNLIEWARNNTTTDNEALTVYDNANTVLYTYNDSSLVYYNETDDPLGVDNEYAILYSIDIAAGYAFPESITKLHWSDQKPITEIDDFTIMVNGVERSDVYVAYSNEWYCIMIFVPIGKALNAIPVYRMYNPITSEHLYTTDANEVEVLFKEHGWGKEGIGWFSSTSGTPIYRLYNPGLGNHLYTSDANEIEVLTTQHGWVKDNNGQPVMYSTGNKSDIPIYRVYNEVLSGMHHLTTDENEYNILPDYGWQQEGISMYAIKIGIPETTYYYEVLE